MKNYPKFIFHVYIGNEVNFDKNVDSTKYK